MRQRKLEQERALPVSGGASQTGHMMREDIRKRQNSEWALDRLVVQRLLYRQVKSVENWRLTLILLVAVLLLSGLASGGWYV